jgi:spore coat polysaccharide biosynthesis predicted glycosyltransferase SpsG
VIREQTICFAAAASEQIGAGHVARCARFAKYLNTIGFQTHLRGELSLGWLKKQCDDTFLTYSEIHQYEEFDFLVLDSYDDSFLLGARQYISSRAKFQIADTSTPIIEGFDIIWLEVAQPKLDLISNANLIAFGRDFFPVKKFPEKHLMNQASNVLFVTGATDNSTLVNFVAKLLDVEKYRHINFHVLSSVCFDLRLPSNWRCYGLGENFEYLISLCDTVISASGTSMWDFIANGIPLGIFRITRNQDENYSYASQNNLAIGLEYDTENLHDLYKLFDSLFFDAEERRNMVRRGLQQFNFRGVENFGMLFQERVF